MLRLTLFFLRISRQSTRTSSAVIQINSVRNFPKSYLRIEDSNTRSTLGMRNPRTLTLIRSPTLRLRSRWRKFRTFLARGWSERAQALGVRRYSLWKSQKGSGGCVLTTVRWTLSRRRIPILYLVSRSVLIGLATLLWFPRSIWQLALIKFESPKIVFGRLLSILEWANLNI